VADKPVVGLFLEKADALATLAACAEFRTWTVGRTRLIHGTVRYHAAQVAEKVPAPPLVIYGAIAGAIASVCLGSDKTCDPRAHLSAEEYRRRYELGRGRYLEEKARRQARRSAWRQENGPWLLLATIAVVLIVFLGIAQPPRFIVVTSLALYGGLAWVVGWVVRASGRTTRTSGDNRLTS
jgi:hypothetical protein